jgi:peptide/nickel transport system ATP-binding protein
MYAGEVVESGPVGEVFKRPAHPYTLKLMGTVPKLGQGPQPLGFIPGQVPNMAAPPAGCAFNPRCERATGRCNHAAPRVVIGKEHWAACHNILVKV